MAMRKRWEVEYPNAAGIDVGASMHYVAVPADRAEDSVRRFGVFTADLEALADWLSACEVDTVALESTGVYWIALYEGLERRGFQVFLVNTRAVKNVPGRKSDVLDCQWLQQLMTYGLLRGAYRPQESVCVVRAVVRHRETLLQEQSRQIQRMQKALTQMNLQLAEVLSDVMGATGEAIIRAIMAGERDGAKLARLRHARVRADEATIARALTGTWREEHLFVLGQAVALYDAYAGQIKGCDEKIEALLGSLARTQAKPEGKGKARTKSSPVFDLRTALYRWAGVDLTRINALDATTVLKVLAEIGPDFSRFPTVKHFCAWINICPGTRITGGKRISGRAKVAANRVKQALKMAAMSLSRSRSALGAYYRRMCTRMDKAKANTAAAHKLARMIYFMVTRGEAFVDRGEAHYAQQYRQRSIANLKRRAAALGLKLVETPHTA